MTGTIIKAISGFYYVNSENCIYECKARGSFRNRGVSPLVGDRVSFTPINDKSAVIEKILPRNTYLLRPAIANIDKLFIVASYSTPAPDLLTIDRISAVALFHKIEPIIVFNKSDTGDFSFFKNIYDKTGLKTYVVSAKNGNGIDMLKTELSDCVSAFAGNSGVGKSSIINAVFGNDFLKTGDVSQKLGRGRHTTRHTELYRHKFGGFIADTPGFSSAELCENSYEFKIALADCFPEFSEYKNSCRFSGCSHTCEIGCAVIDALENGKIEKTRHDSYKQMFEELKKINSWSK